MSLYPFHTSPAPLIPERSDGVGWSLDLCLAFITKNQPKRIFRLCSCQNRFRTQSENSRLTILSLSESQPTCGAAACCAAIQGGSLLRAHLFFRAVRKLAAHRRNFPVCSTVCVGWVYFRGGVNKAHPGKCRRDVGDACPRWVFCTSPSCMAIAPVTAVWICCIGRCSKREGWFASGFPSATHYPPSHNHGS